MTKPNELQQAILQVMAEVPYVKKTHSRELGHSFASERELIAHLRPAMVRAGLTLTPMLTELLSSDDGGDRTASGKSQHRVLIRKTLRLSHAPSGRSLRVVVAAGARSHGDKALALAETYAYKLALRQVFMIETGDDEDSVVQERIKKQERPYTPAFERAVKTLGEKRTADEIDTLLSAACRLLKPHEVEALTTLAAQRKVELSS